MRLTGVTPSHVPLASLFDQVSTCFHGTHNTQLSPSTADCHYFLSCHEYLSAKGSESRVPHALALESNHS
jgi:hypothetical protein